MRPKKHAVWAVLFFYSVIFPVFSEEIVHTLQKGETIYSVARSYGASPAAVLALNGLNEADARTVQAGYRLRIPRSASAPAGYGEYRVAKGDTLYSIARRGGISVAELLDMNGFSPNYVIKEGERIRIPASGASSPSAVASGTASPASSVPASSSGGIPATGNKADSSLRWPVRAKDVSYLTGKLYGVMVTGERSEPVKSLTQGTVVHAGPYRGFGRVAIVQVSGGYLYVYGGCESLSVKEGDRIASGAELGRLGIDAKTEKPQLFFMVYRSNNPVDPAKAPRA
ncbi:MAG: LysM peptidoglycan-binding domain-containing protein [Treponema sp.]|jgi:murein DD-endopeptidase MepM/ murein hydrolase activator NlpD|nr:LysM peptidoglycan-binding domain-containing protein [Treponema sp.]